MIGSTLAHFEIIEQLGAGGMGEVYRAHDTVLDRDVAIKVLYEDLAQESEHLARFEREGRLLASLSHPNIASIFSLEDSEGVRFIVMELVEGETLAERIACSGPIEVDAALEIAHQIAEALEAAHGEGIIHRDLKPANIKVSLEDRVKVLDFGLAKPFEAKPPEEDLSHSPTISIGETKTGVILGTAAYMSPEQACCRPLDKRTDIWSFGCVLFEMLTSRRPFLEDTVSETTAAILKDEPDWHALPAATPAIACSLLQRCLSKDPNQRLHDIADARIEIDAALTSEDRTDLMDRDEMPSVRPVWRRLLRVVGLVALGLVAGYVTTRLLPESEPPSLQRIPMALPPGLNPSFGYGPSVAISPDGRNLAYVLETGMNTLLYVKAYEDLEARPVTGTEGARTPFFSPDGRWIGFFDLDDRKLKKVSLGGGEPREVTNADNVWGAAWAPDDTIVFTSRYTGLVRVPAAGGVPQPVTTAEAIQHSWPTLLPDGEVALFSILPVGGSFDSAKIAAVPIAGGTPKIVLESGYYPHYAPTGHLIYVQGNRVLAVPFDNDDLEVSGDPVTLLEGLRASSWTGYADFAFSDTGTFVYISGGPDPNRATVVSVDRSGSANVLMHERRPYGAPRFSPEGRRLAVTILDQQVDIWTFDLELSSADRLTESDGWDAYPLWQPGTDWVSFSSMRDGLPTIFRKNLRTSDVEKLMDPGHSQYPGSWSPDGRLLAYWEENPETGLDIWVYSNETRSATEFLRTGHNESAPEFSPDGRFIAYESNKAGQQLDVYVRPYPEVTPEVKISTAGGRSARWGPDGKELFFLAGEALMSVEIVTETGLTATAPRELFRGAYGRRYDAAPDGQSFLMIREMAEGDSPVRINLIANWFEALRRSAPTAR